MTTEAFEVLGPGTVRDAVSGLHYFSAAEIQRRLAAIRAAGRSVDELATALVSAAIRAEEGLR